MKSLFKRTLAAATGSVIALSQLAAMAVNVNVSAADTAPASGVTTVDKKFCLNVPVAKADPFKITASDWNDKLESELLAAGKKEFSAHASELRTKFINRMARIMFYGGSATKDQASRFAACFSDINVTANPDGTFTAKVAMYDAAQVTTEIYMDTIARLMDGKVTTDDGSKQIVPDFSGVKIAGEFIIEGKTDFDKKTISTSAKFVDDEGNEYKDAESAFEVDGYCQHVMNEIGLAATIAADDAEKDGSKTEKFTDAVNKIAKNGFNFNQDVLKAAKAVNSIKIEGTDYNQVYSDYLAKVDEKLAAAKISDRNKERITNQLVKYFPETASEGFTDALVNHYYNSAVDFVNKHYNNIQVSLKPADVQEVLDSAVEAEYAFTNGYSFNAKVKIDDDQKDELLTELIASGMTAQEVKDKYGYEIIIDGDETGVDLADLSTYEYVAVDSVKTIFFADSTNDYGLNTEFFYDVLRDVQAVHIVPKTVTTTTTTTTDITTTTTSEEGQGGSTTTTTEEGQPGGSTTTTTEEGQPGGSTTTTTEEGQPGGSTTTTTTANPDDQGSTTTTTYVNFVAFDIEGFGDEGLVYWSEETTPFDLSKLSVTLRIYEEGIDTGKTVDVSGAFQASATDPTQCEKPDGIGIAATPVAYKLTDAETVQKAILDAGYDQETIEANGIKEGMEVSDLIVYLVNRGDTNLNGTVGAEDAQYALVYYTATLVAQETAGELLADPDATYLKDKGELAEKYLPFSHYAADAANGDGKITAEDAQAILSYFTCWVVSHIEGEWSWDNEHIPVQSHTPLEELHAKPLSKDTYCSDVADLFDKSLAG